MDLKYNLKNKIFCLVGAMITSIAFITTSMNVNSTCFFFANQPELPGSAKKLRKF